MEPECVFTRGCRCSALFIFPEVLTIANAAHQINEEILDKEVRLIGAQGEQLGIMSAEEALKIAAEHDLDFTDDCQLVEAMGVKINMTPSDYKNIKITTPEDMAIAEAIMNQ